jgi:hypothetical protein
MTTKLGPAYVFNHRPHKPMPKPLYPAAKALKAAGFDLLFRWSRNHVPHLVVMADENFSVCWFGKGRFFRVFFPYPSPSMGPERFDLLTPEAVVEKVQELMEAGG